MNKHQTNQLIKDVDKFLKQIGYTSSGNSVAARVEKYVTENEVLYPNVDNLPAVRTGIRKLANSEINGMTAQEFNSFVESLENSYAELATRVIQHCADVVIVDGNPVIAKEKILKLKEKYQSPDTTHLKTNLLSWKH